MLTVLRQMLSILLLPFMAAVVMPWWLLTAFADIDTRWSGSPHLAWMPRSLGILIILGGLALFAWCVSLFARIGKGTLAPWDPTRNLVTAGPYRVVRNPMISAVASTLVGLAIFRGSWLLCSWACIFIIVNHVYFVSSEEPGLEKRFGEQYRTYKEQVPRWIPKFR